MQLHRRAATCRPTSMGGIPPIPYTVIRDLLSEEGIGDNERPMMEHLIGVVEDWIVDYHENKPKQKAPEKPRGRRR